MHRRNNNLLMVIAAAVLAAVNTPAMAADTFEELGKAAVFTFALFSDNHGSSPFTASRPGYSFVVHMDRMDQWIKENNDRFVVGVGDHTYHYYRDDPFIPFTNTDPFWYANFYPCIGNHDNKCYSNSESTWCGGRPLFDEVGLCQRPWVFCRPDACDYHAQIPVGDWTVHVIHVNYSYDPPSTYFRQESRDFLINRLNSITRTGKEIVVAVAHIGTQTDGNWVSVLSPAEQDVVMQKCDIVLAGHTHRYQRYIHPSYGETGGALCLNTGCVTGGDPDDCYLECFVFDNPPRVVVARQRIDDCATPQLRIDSFNNAWSSYVKKLGQVANSISWINSNDGWDTLPAGVSSPEGSFNTGWNLISIPLDPANSNAASVLSGLVAAGNKLENNLIRYEPGTGYQVYPRDFTSLQAGRGYWLRLQQPGSTSFVGTSRPDTTYIPLAQGWSLVSLPRTWPLALGYCKIKRGSDTPINWSNAIQLGWIGDALYYYEGGTYKTLKLTGGDDTYLRPWKAYWIRTTRSDLSMVIPRPIEPTPVLKIADVQATNIGKTTATITWTSLICSTSRVDFGPTLAYGEYVYDGGLTRTHSMTISGLAPGTTYHYKVTSTADLYNPGVSADTVFTTASSGSPIADPGFESGTLNDWIPWPSGTNLMQVGTYSALGKIYPHSGSYMAYSLWAQVTQNGGLYARAAVTPGLTYEASVWSNGFCASTPPVPLGDCKARIGIDPLGGRDPAAASVIWSAWDERANAAPQQWRRLAVQAQAQSSVVTVFLEFYQKQQPQYYQMVNAFDDAAITQVGP